MYVTRPIRNGGECPHTVTPPRQLPLSQGLSLGNYHICDGRGFGLSESVRVAQIEGVDLMVMTATNITDQVCHQNSTGYGVVWLKLITNADGDTQGESDMVFRD